MQPPHENPGSDDAVDAYRAKLEAYKRRTRNRVFAALGGCVLLGVGVFAASSYLDPMRALEASRPATDPIKAKYCKILDVENARPQDDPKASPPTTVKINVTEPIRSLGFFALDYDKISDPNPRGNADGIELGEIAWLCGNREGHYSPDLLFSNFTRLYETNGAAKSYQKKGIERLVSTLPRLKYLVVARKKSYQASVSSGQGTMQPGHYAAKVMLYRLDDAALVAETWIDQDAPSVASVYVMQDRYGQASQSSINSGLDADTRSAFESAFKHRFGDLGLDVSLDYGDK